MGCLLGNNMEVERLVKLTTIEAALCEMRETKRVLGRLSIFLKVHRRKNVSGKIRNVGILASAR